MVVLALLRNVKGRCFFVVKRALPDAASTGFVETNLISNDIEYVQPVFDPGYVVAS